MSSRVIQSKHIYDAGFHEFYTYGTGALNSNIGILNSVQTMTIKNGNVGIGTATPTQKLHIEGNIFAKGNIVCSNISVIGDFVTLNTITSNTEQVVVENAGTGPALKVTQTGNNSVAEFYDNESGLAMIVGNNGNIGIGTTMPMAKLHVQNGYLIAYPIISILQDRKASNTNAQSSINGWNKRNINHPHIDRIGITISSDTFTIPPGTYHFEASAPAYGNRSHKIVLSNSDRSTIYLVGMPEYAGLWNTTPQAIIGNRAFLDGIYTFISTTTLAIWHYTENNASMGVAVGVGVDEIYTSIKIIKYE